MTLVPSNSQGTQFTGGEVANASTFDALVTLSAGLKTAPTPATHSLSSTVGAQMSTAHDAHSYTSVTFTPTAGAAATCAVAISADNVSYTALWTETVPLGTALDSFVIGISVYVPAGYYLKLTTANATLGTTTYY